MPLIAGRDLTDDDRTRGVAIVNQQFAREFFQGDALGKTFEFFDGRALRIVGIAANAHFHELREEPQPVMYFPMSDDVHGVPFASAFLQVRAARSDAAMLAQLRALVAVIDPRVLIDQATTMEMQIDQALARERLLAFLSTTTGAIAVLLAAMGLYGVMSFAVAQRRREIAIRMAIGATRQNIMAQFLVDSVGMVASGAALGIPLAVACGKAATSLLYGLQGEAAATGLRAAIALAAALIPAWRAARVDPTIALRWE